MEPSSDDPVDFVLAMLYRRKAALDVMIQRLEEHEPYLSTERFLAPRISDLKRPARKILCFEPVKAPTPIFRIEPWSASE